MNVIIENNPDPKTRYTPKILAPAGNKTSFLAAIAAGADAIYCGLKNFSARMEADNFSTEELSVLTTLAHSRGISVYIALNSILKPGDIEKAAHLVDKLNRHVKPDALIISDFALIHIAKAVGFKGELHLSTLANMSFPKGFDYIREKLTLDRVVLPRELHVDEIKKMADACPGGLDLEVFIHGALCYGVSGRCYWSSFLGGKSGLRGRCVQPCRRIYAQGDERKRYFSCQDLSLDVLVKVLSGIPKISTWKIEGRKKGPHYVYYTVTAYKMLRDQGHDPQAKKTALGLLEQALGRPSTHYRFLPQRPQNPVDTDKQTGSGLLVGVLKGPLKAPFLVPRFDLLSGDLLRIGYEDAEGHAVQKVYKSVPKKGRLTLKFNGPRYPAMDSPVFLIDRREKELESLIRKLEAECDAISGEPVSPSSVTVKIPKTNRKTGKHRRFPTDTAVYRTAPSRLHDNDGLWMSESNLSRVSGKLASMCWFWLPPVIWPEHQDSWLELIEQAIKKGVRRFVANAPYQIAFFEKPGLLDIWAGPFCNISNGLAASVLASSGFSGVFASPELSGDDFSEFANQSPVPSGMVISGHMPLVIARTLSDKIDPVTPFKSPKGEEAWAVQHGSDFWIYPNWTLDLTKQKEALVRAGFTLFAHMSEPVPKSVTLRNRPGKWNWELTLL